MSTMDLELIQRGWKNASKTEHLLKFDQPPVAAGKTGVQTE